MNVLMNSIALLACGLTASLTQASSLYCPQGRAQYATTGFGVVDDSVQPALSCPELGAACVDARLCPRVESLFCEQGQFMRITRSFISVPGNSNLSCPQEEGSCVDESLCPSFEPIHCTKGQAVHTIIGFNPIPNKPGFSCPIYQMACLDRDLCPQR